MEKMKRIYEEINSISPVRFVVRIEAKSPIVIKTLNQNIKDFLFTSKINKEEVIIQDSVDLERDTTNSIVTHNRKIDVYIKGCSLGVVFDHSIADAKTAITFCLNILRKDCPTWRDDNIDQLEKVFPNKFQGFSGLMLTLKAAFLQLSSSLIHGKTTNPVHYKKTESFLKTNLSSNKLSKAKTDSLIKKSKITSSSISTILLASQIKATQEVLFNGNDIPIAVTAAVDLRKRSKVNPQYGFLSLCVSFLTIVVKVKNKDSFSRLLHQTKNKLSNKIKHGAYFTLYKMLPPKFLISKSIVAFFMNIMEKGSLQTNVGRIEDFYKLPTDQFKSVDFFVPPGKTHPFSISASTFRGELSLSVFSFSDRIDSTLTNKVLENMISTIS